MVNSKRIIAAIIVCLKPHVFITLSIILVIVHSIVIAFQRGISLNWRVDVDQDVTLSTSMLIIAIALMWGAFFIFMINFELRSEMNSLLVLFQCSKRGLRFLGVLSCHVILLTFVALLVSLMVERSIPIGGFKSEKLVPKKSDDYTHREINEIKKTRSIFIDNPEELGRHRFDYLHTPPVPTSQNSVSKNFLNSRAKMDRGYLLIVYKIWLTAIVYSFTYLVLENMSMFFADMSLVECIHEGFLHAVAKLTGIDLSDCPAGEMLFNPLVRRRFAML